MISIFCDGNAVCSALQVTQRTQVSSAVTAKRTTNDHMLAMGLRAGCKVADRTPLSAFLTAPLLAAHNPVASMKLSLQQSGAGDIWWPTKLSFSVPC